jgi:hypothetical protein
MKMTKLEGIYHEALQRPDENHPRWMELNGWEFTDGEVTHTILHGGGRHGFVYYDRYNRLLDELEEVEEVWLEDVYTPSG